MSSCWRFPSWAFGVAHCFANRASAGRIAAPADRERFERVLTIASGSVGQDEQPPSPMGSADIGRSYSRPFRIEPVFGKVTEDSVEAQSKVPCDVLQEREGWSYLAKHPADLGPEVAFVALALALAGDGKRLAGVSGGDEIDRSSQGSGVQVGEVTAPDRSRIQGRVFHPRQEDGRSVGVPLNVTHHSGGVGKSDTFVQPSDPGAERQNA